MGTSTDGILFFGIDLGAEEELEIELSWQNDKYDGDWEKFVAEKFEVVEPKVNYEGNEELFSEYWKKQREIIKTLDCKIDYHCSSEYPCFLIAPKDKILTASRGYPEEVTEDFMKVTGEHIEKLKKFCELIEIPWSEPKWHLASYWG